MRRKPSSDGSSEPSQNCSSFSRSRSNARLPLSPFSSIRSWFLRPVANLGRLERGQRAGVQPGGEHRGVVHGHRPGARCLPGRLGQRALADEGGGDRGDTGDQLAGQVLGQVHDVRSQVAERAGPGSLALQPPGQRERRVHQPVLEVTRAHVADPADPAVGHELAGQGQGRDAAVVEAGHRADAPGGGPRRRGRHGLGLGQRVGERLLAQHVLARLERRDGDLGVQVARRAHVHELDVVAFDQGVPVRVRGRPAEPARRGAHRGRVPAAQHGHGGLQRQVEHVRRGPPGLRVGRAHERVADHAHAEHRAARTLARCLLHPRSSRQAGTQDAGSSRVLAFGSQSGSSSLGQAERRPYRLERALRGGPPDRLHGLEHMPAPAHPTRAGGRRRRVARGPCRARRARARQWPQRLAGPAIRQCL